MKDSISIEELETHATDKAAFVRYLLRLGIGKNGAFKSMAEMARDLGVSDGYIRQVKYRKIHTGSYKVHRDSYVEGVLRLWPKRMPV